MFILLGSVRMNTGYLADFLASYASEDDVVHLSFIDEVRVFPLRDISSWTNTHDIEHVSVDHNAKSISIKFNDEKKALDYCRYLDEYFLGN
jgi:hypothetical protein